MYYCLQNTSDPWTEFNVLVVKGSIAKTVTSSIKELTEHPHQVTSAWIRTTKTCIYTALWKYQTGNTNINSYQCFAWNILSQTTGTGVRGTGTVCCF